MRPDGSLRQLVSSAVGWPRPTAPLESVAGQVVDVTEPVRLTTSRDVDEALEQLSQSRPSIDQAKGALMFAYRIDEETAFELLREYSQHLNLKVRDLARDLTEATRQPGGWSPGTRNLLDRLMQRPQRRRLGREPRRLTAQLSGQLSGPALARTHSTNGLPARQSARTMSSSSAVWMTGSNP